jgi:hypothetical protein
VRAGTADADHRCKTWKKRGPSEAPSWSRSGKRTGGVHGNIPNALTTLESEAPTEVRCLSAMTFSLRKEVIQPQVLLRLPCYDFTPIMSYTLDGCFLAVSPPASSTAHFRDVTGGVYKARERIHRGVLIRDY